MSDPIPTVTVTPFERTRDVRWRDGKPWCPKHNVVLVRLHPKPGPFRWDVPFVCHRCWAWVTEGNTE